MDPVAVELFTGAFRPLHARAWDVQTDTDGLDAPARAQPPAPAGLPAQPPLLRRPAGARRRPRRSTTSRATTCSAGTTSAFWPIGPLAKRAGLVFIRRSFGDDEVYKLAVREYFAFLLAKRFNLEWYMEGGRSRTGKLRPPQHGLLRYVADAVERGRVDDVFLVPVSITYDQLREVSGMAAEQRGAAKRPRACRGSPSYARGQLTTPLGHRARRFAEPLSLAAALRAGADPDDPAPGGSPCRRSPSRSPSASTASPPRWRRRWSRSRCSGSATAR